MRRTIIVIAVAGATAALLAWAAAAAGGSLADCAPYCDCEVIGSGAVKQPVNAWASLAIVAAGVLVMARGSRLAPGMAVVAIGLAAWAAHATAAGWAYTVEGAVLAGAAWVLAIPGRPRAWWLVPPAVAAVAWWLAMPAVAVAVGAAAVVLILRGWLRGLRPSVTAAIVVALGGGSILRWLADDGGPWCSPDAAIPGHAVWHVLAAVGLGLLAAAVSAPASPAGLLRSDPAETPTETRE